MRDRTPPRRNASLVLAACACVCACSLACTGDEPDPGARPPEDAGLSATAAEVDEAPPLYTWHYDRTGAELDSLAQAAQSGYRPVAISAYGTALASRYAVVFAQRSGAEWRILRGTSATSFQSAVAAQGQAGLRPALVSLDGPATRPVWAAVFIASGTAYPELHAGLVSGDTADPATVQYWIASAQRNKLIPASIAIYGSDSSPRYALVLEPNAGNVEWALGNWYVDGVGNPGWTGEGLNDTLAEHAARVSAQTAAGNRAALTEQTANRHIALFRDDRSLFSFEYHGLSATALQDTITLLDTAYGLSPVSIQGGGGGSGTAASFSAIFSYDERPQPRRFSSVGSGAADDTAALPDLIVADFMVRNDVRHAALAVVSGTKLVYARGYTYGEADFPVARAMTRFRVASVSKVVIAAQIMRLVDVGLLGLDEHPQDILQLRRPDGTPPVAAFGDVTIRNLLKHSYPGGQCLLRDADVWTPIGGVLPVTLGPAVSRAVASPDLLHTRPPGEGCYSNFAYTLLGMVIEKRRGVPLKEALQADLLAPLSITRFGQAVSPAAEQPADEAHYTAGFLHTGFSIQSIDQPIAAGPYGTDNFDVGFAPGGMSIAATDMARILAMLNSQENPVFTNPLHRTPSAQAQLLADAIGFDGFIGGSGSGAAGPRMVKGGLLDGLQSEVVLASAPGSLSYVLYWARNAVPKSGDPVDFWYPSWPRLDQALVQADVQARRDLFPDYGMPSL